MNEYTFKVTDDSGFLALIDPVAYEGFVSEKWDMPDLLATFAAQARQNRILIWGTGLEMIWHVKVSFTPVEITGFQELTGSIVATDGLLLITNFESLTMAAQFSDTDLPEPSERDQLLRVESGAYRCRVIQLQDHEYDRGSDIDLEGADVHFILELLRSDEVIAPWPLIPWSDLKA